MHEKRLNPETFEYDMIETDMDEAEVQTAAEGRRIMELFRANGNPGLDKDHLIEFIRQERNHER